MSLLKFIILFMQLIIIALCHRVPKDEDLSRRHDTTPRHQEYDKKMLESLLKEVISDELSKMKSTFDQPKETFEPRRKERTSASSSKDEIDPAFSSLMEEKLRLEKLRKKLEQEVSHRERIREERDREERLREEKSRKELKRLERLLTEAKSKIKDSSKLSSFERDQDRETSDPLKMFSLKDLDAMTDESKFTESGDSWMNQDLMKDYVDQQMFDFPMIPPNDRPTFLPPAPKAPTPPMNQFIPSPSPSSFMPNFARPFNPSGHPPPPSFGERPRAPHMPYPPPHRPFYPGYSPSMNRFSSQPPPPLPMRSSIRIGNGGQSLTAMASSMYPSFYGKKSRSEGKEEPKPGKKIKSAIKDFAVSSIIDVGMMSLMNNLLGKINAEPGTGRRMLFFSQ